MFIVFAIISFSIAYRRAKEAERNAFLWGIIAAAVFIATGFFLSLGFGVLLEATAEILKLSENTAEKYMLVGGIISTIASFGTTWLILRKLRVKPPESSLLRTPPPPLFNRD